IVPNLTVRTACDPQQPIGADQLSAAMPCQARADSRSCRSRFPCTPFQFSKGAAREAPQFSRSAVQLLGVIGAARLECGEPAAKASELIRRQLGNSFGDFFDVHVAQYSTAEAWSATERDWAPTLAGAWPG